MKRLRKARDAYAQALERAQRVQGLRRGSRLAAVLHSVEHCSFPTSVRGHPRRSYNAHHLRDVVDAVTATVNDLQREMRVAMVERHGKIHEATPLVTPAHWARELARRLAPQYEAWEADPDYRPARRPPDRHQAWREEVAERCLYHEIPARVWDHVRSVDESASSFAGQRFRIGPAIVKKRVPRKSRGF